LRRAFTLLVFYVVCMLLLNTFLFGGITRLRRWQDLTGRRRSQDVTVGLVLLALAAFLVSAVLTTWICGHLILYIYPDMRVLGLDQYLMVSLCSAVFGIPAFLYLVVRELWKKALTRVREKEVAQERLEKELLAARLQALQAQTNPHFLFNALNSIAALITSDPKRAEATVERLASLFRYVTDRHDGCWVQLSEEIAVVEDYLAIEKVRFGDRLQWRVAVDPTLLGCRVPPLLLQPLVENAVKHGVATREDETTLEVVVGALPGDRLRMIVRNQGPPPAPEPEWRGVGLTNLRSRCRTLFAGRFRFDLSQVTPGWTAAALEIPRQERPEAMPEELTAVDRV
jgi:sensor histidine kinase YesM